MCITKIEAFAYDGKTYTREIDAIVAAVAKRIGNNEAIARNITDSAADLIPLLQRVVEMRQPEKSKEGAPSNEQKGPAADEDPPMPPEAVRELLVNTIVLVGEKDKPAMRKLLEEAGYDGLKQLQDTASDMHVNALLAKVVGNKVEGVTLDAQGHKPNCHARATGFEADCSCGVLIRDRATYNLPA